MDDVVAGWKEQVAERLKGELGYHSWLQLFYFYNHSLVLHNQTEFVCRIAGKVRGAFDGATATGARDGEVEQRDRGGGGEARGAEGAVRGGDQGAGRGEGEEGGGGGRREGGAHVSGGLPATDQRDGAETSELGLEQRARNRGQYVVKLKTTFSAC